MKKNKKLKFISLIFLSLFVLFCQTIVYSAINATMSVRGDAYARVETDVRITGFRLATTLNASSNYEEFGKNHISTEVNLTNSSSKIMYYIEITNYGSNDIGIFDITGLPDGVTYSLSNYNLHDKICDDTGKCNSFIKKTLELTLTTTSSYSGNIQLNFDFRTFHQVTYTNITNNSYPTEVIDGGDLNVTFTESLKRVQVLSNNTELGYYTSILSGQTISLNNITSDVEVKIKNYVAKLISGELDEVGSEVCIGEECFYIISNDGSIVTMFAKYNLYVGGSYTESTWTAYGEEATGKQNSNMLGWTSNSSTWEGLINYSNMTNDSSNYETSVVKNYINNYGSYLQSVGAVYNNIRLITTDELVSLGCDESSNSCSNAKSFVMNTSFWTETAYDSNYVWFVVTDGNYDHYITSNRKDRFGVRPVIEMSIDEIRPLLRIESGDLDTVGSELCISDECFYVISSDDTSVTMITKYNLSAGRIFTGEEDEDFDYIFNSIDNPTGMQDENMIGATANRIYPYNGVLSYGDFTSPTSIPSYIYDSQSNLYPYIENYKNILNNTGCHVNEARLINNEELSTFGCNIRDDIGYEQCYGIPSWMSSTTYWTGVASGQSTIACISTSGQWENTDTGDVYNYGIRPVIEMPKWNFANKIKFTISGGTYYAKEGMSWGEWIDSIYNPTEALVQPDLCSNGREYHLSGSYIKNSLQDAIELNGNKVLPTDAIIAGAEYDIN